MPNVYKNAQVSGTASVGTYSTLYKTPTSSTAAVISTLVICNTSASVQTYRIGIMSTEGTPSNQNFVVYDSPIAAKDTIALSLGITLPASASDNNVIRISSSNAAVEFHAFISEVT